MEKYKAIVFDMDGTVLDTLDELTKSLNYVFARHGLPALTQDAIRPCLGFGYDGFIDKAAPDAPEPLRRTMTEEFIAYYSAHCQIKTKPYEGIPEALAALGAHHPLAIVSNKPDAAVKTLCADIFPGIYARGESPDCPRKPAADMVYKAMASIGADTCIYVGDSDVDVLTANNAGVPCLSVLWGFRDRACMESVGAKHFCETPAHLVADIEEIIHGK